MWILLCYNGLVFPRNSVADTHVSDTYCSGVEAATSHEGQRQERKSAKKAKSSVTREGKGSIIKNSSAKRQTTRVAVARAVAPRAARTRAAKECRERRGQRSRSLSS
ncbi:hypothetical protein JG688_00005998 [Phytophthora aleatoria]|uniref:Uncharacterized protein n=1 Tax=Phytophthora aleatoria TaxID=2496075 RepID=A0A8J5MHB0_9STRA|nr:hypothetical protein JG688_00005998 [Phytophthora aleatoria]